MSGEIPPESGPRRRLLPSVSEVVRGVTETVKADPAVIFKYSRQVCAEELLRVKQGQEAAPIAVLIEKAAGLIQRGGRPAAPEPQPPPAKTLMAPPPASDDPFGETAGALDLSWEGEQKDPFTIAEAASTEILPQVLGSSSNEGLPVRGPFALPADEVPREPGPAAALLAQLQEKARDVAEPGPGPFAPSVEDETFPEEHREAPDEKAEDDDVGEEPPAQAAAEEEAPGPPPSGGRGIWLVAAGIVVVAALAGGYFLLGRKVPKGPSPIPAAQRSTPAPAVSPEPTQPTVEVTLPVPTVALVATPEPNLTVSVRTPTPAPQPVVPVAQPGSVRPVVAPVVSPAVAADAATRKPTAPASSSAEAPKQTRAGTLVTTDWTGKPPIFVIHFSSFKDRPSAEADAARLRKTHGLPARAFEVDLGEKGLWYRSGLGEFATAEEALQLREDLLAKGTPNMGLVYMVRGK